MMSAKENPADTNSSSPGKQRKPEHEIDGSNDDEDDGQHDGPGGVTRGEAELVHHLHRGILIIDIVGGTAASCEGLDNRDYDDVQNESEEEVEEKGAGEGVEASNTDE